MKTAVLILFMILLQACSSPPERHAVPGEFLSGVSIPGIPYARAMLSEFTTHTGAEADEITEKFLERASKLAAAAKLYPDFLAISGGGAEGAFTAGLLVGWTAEGTRPVFGVVSGVSTGALIAPFAFLGPEYDHVIETLFTTSDTENIAKRLGLRKILRSAALADTGPLRDIIATAVDEEFLKKVAMEHEKGRRLIIGTTNLDSQTAVVWNMGAIAQSGQTNALQLFRDVMLASASIPGAFPPVLIEVEANGQRFDEMHVDGGVSKQVFAYPPGLNIAALAQTLGLDLELRLFLIRNSRILPENRPVNIKLKDIVEVSTSMLIRSQGNSNITETYQATQRDGIQFRLAYVPPNFNEEPEEAFDQVYMKKLFDLSYNLAVKGYPWSDQPPWFDEVVPDIAYPSETAHSRTQE